MNITSFSFHNCHDFCILFLYVKTKKYGNCLGTDLFHSEHLKYNNSPRFISTDKTETMAFNVDEEIKSRTSLISIGDVALKNVRAFKYLGHMIIHTDDSQSNFLNSRISSVYQKWNDLKHVLTDRRVSMTTRTQIVEACIRTRLLYSVHAWELSSRELDKIESIAHGFKRKNVPLEYLKKKRSNPKSATDILEPVDLEWAFVYANNDLVNITKTSSNFNFCITQHLKYIAHVTRLSNDSLQKQVLFSCEHKRYAHDVG